MRTALSAPADADLPVGVIRADSEGRVLAINPEAAARLAPFGGGGAARLPERFGPAAREVGALAAKLDRPGARARRLLGAPGGGALALTLSRNAEGGLVALLEDGSAEARREAEAHRAQARWAALADWSPRAAVFALDADGRVSSWSRSAERFEGLAAREALGAPLALLLERARFAVDAAALLAEAARAGAAEAEGWRFAFTGGPVWARLTLRALADLHGAPDGFLAVARAASETESRTAAREAELRRLAATDPLTGVMNRRALFESIETMRRISLASRPGPAAILCDLDRFKAVNDAFGHAAGDAALRAFAAAASRALRAGDLIGRLGGDEFAIALPGADAARAALVAERLRAALAAVVVPEAEGLALSASFGVAAPLGPAETFAQTLARADAALYCAKREGRDRVAAA